MLSRSCSAASIAAGEEADVMFWIISVCWVSRLESWEAGMVGWDGREASIGEVDLAAATEDGRVSGSKRAFRIRVSLAERVVFGVEIAMLWFGCLSLCGAGLGCVDD